MHLALLTPILLPPFNSSKHSKMLKTFRVALRCLLSAKLQVVSMAVDVPASILKGVLQGNARG